jgi:hypothetical protein
MIKVMLRVENSLELVRFARDPRRFVGLHVLKVPRSGDCLILNRIPPKFIMLRRRIRRSWWNYFAHWGGYVVESGTMARACDWGIMFLPVDEFEDDQKWIRYMATQKGNLLKFNSVHKMKPAGLNNGHIRERS